MRDVLIEHIDGPVPIIRGCNISGPNAKTIATRYKSVWALMDRGLLEKDRDFAPRFTIITDDGRTELAKALADWADALVRAGYGRGFLLPLVTTGRSASARTGYRRPTAPYAPYAAKRALTTGR
jgi:hypothetical protein